MGEDPWMRDEKVVVLIVDSAESSRAILCDALAGTGHVILAAADAAEARRIADIHRPTAVLAAEHLRDGSGFELLLQLCGDRDDCYTALLADRPEVDSLLAVIEADIDDYFVKPLVPEQIRQRLDKGLAALQVRRELTESQEELLRNFQTSQVVNTVLHIGLEDRPLEEKLQMVLDHLLSLPWLAFERKGAIFVVDGASGELVLTVQNGLDSALLESCRRLQPGQCLCGSAVLTKEVVFADGLDERHTVRYDGIMPHGHYIVPILYRDKVLGVVNIYTAAGHPRSTAEEQFLTSVADALAAMILRHREQEERAELERTVRQGQKLEAIGTLAGGIAHDFNNILTSILGYANLLREQCPPGSQMAADLDQIITAGYRAKELVRQILTFARQREGHPQVIQVKALLKEAIKLLRASLPATIDIRQRIDDDGAVVADPAMLHQVIMNLCTNAFRAMGDKGVLDIALDRVQITEFRPGLVGNLSPGEWVCLKVEDDGCGMTPEVLERIFEPYFTTREAEGGTGLGLSTVYGILRDLGGDIRVTSTPGKGSVFEVFLPAAQDAGSVEASVVETALPGGNERLLCVDDEPPIVEICRRSLEYLGYQVTTRTSSVEALELFRARPNDFDLVITDYTMPHMTGLELARKIRAVRSDIPVVLATGYSEMIGPEQLDHYGIDGLLAKPIVRRDLARMVRAVLDGKTGGQRSKSGGKVER